MNSERPSRVGSVESWDATRSVPTWNKVPLAVCHVCVAAWLCVAVCLWVFVVRVCAVCASVTRHALLAPVQMMTATRCRRQPCSTVMSTGCGVLAATPASARRALRHHTTWARTARNTRSTWHEHGADTVTTHFRAPGLQGSSRASSVRGTCVHDGAVATVHEPC